MIYWIISFAFWTFVFAAYFRKAPTPPRKIAINVDEMNEALNGDAAESRPPRPRGKHRKRKPREGDDVVEPVTVDEPSVWDESYEQAVAEREPEEAKV